MVETNKKKNKEDSQMDRQVDWGGGTGGRGRQRGEHIMRWEQRGRRVRQRELQ